MYDVLLNLVTAINIGIYIALAFSVGKRSRRSVANMWFFIFIIFGGFWIVVRFFENLRPYDFVWLVKVDFALAALISGILVNFALHYPNKNPKVTPIKTSLLFVAPVALVVLTFFNVFFKPISTRMSEYYPLYYLYIGVLIIYFIIIGGGLLIKKFRQSVGIQKVQLGYMMVSYLITISILLFDSLHASLNSAFHERSTAVDTAFFNASLIFASGAAYVMIRYRFLDIRIVIKRSLIRLISFSILLVVYLILILVLRNTLISETKELNPVSLIVVGLLIILTVEPLRKYIYNFVDKRFEIHDLQQERIQKQLQIVLKSQQSLSDLEQAIRKAFQETAKVDTVDYLDANDQKLIGKPALRAYLQATGKVVITEELPYRLDEDPRFMQVNDEVKGGTVTAYVPIGQNEIFVGSFVLGQRKGKVAYSAQEVSAMKLLQSQATEAFLNARLYKQAVERIRV